MDTFFHSSLNYTLGWCKKKLLTFKGLALTMPSQGLILFLFLKFEKCLVDVRKLCTELLLTFVILLTLPEGRFANQKYNSSKCKQDLGRKMRFWLKTKCAKSVFSLCSCFYLNVAALKSFYLIHSTALTSSNFFSTLIFSFF